MSAPAPRRRWPRWLVLACVPAAGCLLLRRHWRGWAVYATVPGRVTAGQFASVLLRMAVRGGPLPAARRYRQPVLLLRAGGGWMEVRPARLTSARDDLVCRFDFMVPQGVRALAYRFRFVFDGEAREVPGRRALAVCPKNTRPDLAGPALMRALR